MIYIEIIKSLSIVAMVIIIYFQGKAIVRLLEFAEAQVLFNDKIIRWMDNIEDDSEEEGEDGEQEAHPQI